MKKRPEHITASGLQQAHLCPGSYHRQKGKPNKTNPLAEAGTRIHDALEADDIHSLEDESERDLAFRASQLRAELIDGFFLSQPLFDGVEINHIKEQRLDAFENSVSGRFDGLVIDEHRALLYDYKTGYNEPAEAKHNLQMRCYAVLVAENFEKVTEVTAAIIQPRIKPEISLVEYSADDLTKAKDEVQKILERAYEPGAPINPGESQCAYCRAKDDCPEASQLTTTLSDLQGDSIPDEKLPELLDTCRVAKKIIEAVEDRARTRLDEDGNSIPGYKLKPGALKGEIIKPQLLFNRCNEQFSILPHEFVEICEVKKGALEKLIKKVSGQKGKELKETMDELLNGVVKYKPNRPSLARDKKTIADSPKFIGNEVKRLRRERDHYKDLAKR